MLLVPKINLFFINVFVKKMGMVYAIIPLIVMVKLYVTNGNHLNKQKKLTIIKYIGVSWFSILCFSIIERANRR